MKIYVVINLEAPHKDCVIGVYSTPEFAHHRAKKELLPKTLYQVVEAEIESPGAGFVSIPYSGRNQYLGMFETPKIRKDEN